MNYFECDIPSAPQHCCHKSCPHPDVLIPYGTGYLYIKESLIDFRRQYPILIIAKKARQHKLVQLQQLEQIQQLVTSDLSGKIAEKITEIYRINPALVCQQCAKQLQIDLDVAAADAKYWWESGKGPLRVTPMTSTAQKKPIAKKPSTAIQIFIFILLAILLASSIYLFIRGHYIWGSIFTIAFLVTLILINQSTPEEDNQRQEHAFTKKFEEIKKLREHAIKPLLKLTCSKCNEMYLIGVDSDTIIEGGDILSLLLKDRRESPQIIFPEQRVPDIVDHYCISDDRWVILREEIMQLKYGEYYLIGAIDKSKAKLDVQRQWLCSNCNSINTSNIFSA